VKPALVDTDILSLFLRGDTNVVTNFHAYVQEYRQVNLSIVTFYEIVSGLRHRDAHKQLNSFLSFTSHNVVLPLTEQSAAISAELYATQRKKGEPVDDIDLLIAGIAMANGLILATHNQRHFSKISTLEIQDWSVTLF
jgi:tRNA(fMet)-specific endonuclease VapC